jgi:cyclase
VKEDFWGRPRTWIHGGSRSTGRTPEEHARLAEENGAGEIIIQSIPRDGTMQGYDLDLTRRVSRSVTIPVVALGGAGSYEHLRTAHLEGHASGLAAGSLFVFQGPRRGVLIHYPDRSETGL